MALFSGSSGISLGIAFSRQNVLAVRLDEQRGILLNRQAIAPDSYVNGMIANEQEVVGALAHVVQTEMNAAPEGAKQANAVLQRKWWQKFTQSKNSSKSGSGGKLGVAICLPPEAVYTALFPISSVVGKDLEEEVLGHIQKTIPIEPEDMAYMWRQIGKTSDEQHIAVAALSKRELDRYRIMCSKQKLQVEAVTIPASTVWLSAVDRQKDTAVLATRLSEGSMSVSFLYNSWPIDELVFPPETDMEEMAKQLKQMLQEQIAYHGLKPKKLVVMGTEQDIAGFQNAGLELPVERTGFSVPERLRGYELGLFPILSARKEKLLNLQETIELTEE